MLSFGWHQGSSVFGQLFSHLLTLESYPSGLVSKDIDARFLAP